MFLRILDPDEHLTDPARSLQVFYRICELLRLNPMHLTLPALFFFSYSLLQLFFLLLLQPYVFPPQCGPFLPFLFFEPLHGLTVLLVAEHETPDAWRAFILDKPVCLKKGVWHQTLSLTDEATVKISSAVRYEVSIRAPRRYDEQWSGMPFICSCRTSYNSRYRKVRRRDWGWVGDTVEHVDEPRLWAKCDHMAAVMLLWEHEHGPWVVEETEEELEERWQRIEAEKLKLFFNERYEYIPVMIEANFPGYAMD